MKKGIIALFIVFLSISANRSFAQVSSIPYYTNIHFGDAFFVIAETDEKSDYYVVDLTKLGASFERSYFENLAFNEPKIVRIDAGNPDMLWFKAKKVFTRTEINQLLNSLKEQTRSRADSMTAFQKDEWLNRNNK